MTGDRCVPFFIMKKFGFAKEERLTGKKRIEKLFLNGRSFQSAYLRIYWEPCSSSADFPAQLLISVPKKKFKLATDRNRIKRMIREAYRLNKNEFISTLRNEGKQMQFAIIFTGNDHPLFQPLQDKIILILQRLISELKKEEKINKE